MYPLISDQTSARTITQPRRPRGVATPRAGATARRTADRPADANADARAAIGVRVTDIVDIV